MLCLVTTIDLNLFVSRFHLRGGGGGGGMCRARDSVWFLRFSVAAKFYSAKRKWSVLKLNYSFKYYQSDSIVMKICAWLAVILVVTQRFFSRCGKTPTEIYGSTLFPGGDGNGWCRRPKKMRKGFFGGG